MTVRTIFATLVVGLVATQAWAHDCDASAQTPDQQNELGMQYAAQQDYNTAGYCFSRSADAGYDGGEYNLALMYQNALGVDQNLDEAIKLYRRAADQGMVEAENNLGVMCEKGIGMAPNRAFAEFWYQKASNQGYKLATDNLHALLRQPPPVDAASAAPISGDRYLCSEFAVTDSNPMILAYSASDRVVQTTDTGDVRCVLAYRDGFFGHAYKDCPLHVATASILKQFDFLKPTGIDNFDPLGTQFVSKRGDVITYGVRGANGIVQSFSLNVRDGIFTRDNQPIERCKPL